MQKVSGEVGLHLGNAQTQRGQDRVVDAVDTAVPLELAGNGQRELVGQVAPLVPILVVLVLVQRQAVCRVLVLVTAVTTLHT